MFLDTFILYLNGRYYFGMMRLSETKKKSQTKGWRFIFNFAFVSFIHLTLVDRYHDMGMYSFLSFQSLNSWHNFSNFLHLICLSPFTQYPMVYEIHFNSSLYLRLIWFLSGHGCAFSLLLLQQTESTLTLGQQKRWWWVVFSFV